MQIRQPNWVTNSTTNVDRDLQMKNPAIAGFVRNVRAIAIDTQTSQADGGAVSAPAALPPLHRSGAPRDHACGQAGRCYGH